MILSSDPCFRNTFPENNYKIFIKNYKRSISKVEINLLQKIPFWFVNRTFTLGSVFLELEPAPSINHKSEDDDSITDKSFRFRMDFGTIKPRKFSNSLAEARYELARR